MRRLFPPSFVGAALVAIVAPLLAQGTDPDANVWQLGGLRTGFCVELLLAPNSPVLGSLPQGVRPMPASQVADLPVSLKDVVQGQPEYASWSPSRLCFHLLDTIRTRDFTLGDRSGKHPQLFGTWTVTAAGPGGTAHEAVLELLANSDRLIRSARLAGQAVQEARLTVGKVPVEDENGTPSGEDRIQVKLGKTVVTWDGHLAGDSTRVASPRETDWTASGVRGGEASGKLTLTPTYSRAMAGSLKVDGKDALAKALKASPTRFAGPAYRGGGGTVSFTR
jgi:hypothetical protein